MLDSEDTVLSHRGSSQGRREGHPQTPNPHISPPQQSTGSRFPTNPTTTSQATYQDHGKGTKTNVTDYIEQFVAVITDKKNANKIIICIIVCVFLFSLSIFFATRRHCDIILTGRVGYGTDLTGHYMLQDGEFNGHPFYQSKHQFLYFNARFGNWHISENLGADTSLAYAVGVDHPNAYSADELDQWYIWDAEKFRYDDKVESRCILVSDEGYLSLSPESAFKKCLDVSGGNDRNGANVHLWRCHGGHNQDWHFDSDSGTPQPIISRHGRCLEASSLAENSNVQIWDCNFRNNQKWEYNYETKEIRTTNDLCLHAAGASRDGTNVIIAQCTGSKRQKWTL